MVFSLQNELDRVYLKDNGSYYKWSYNSITIKWRGRMINELFPKRGRIDSWIRRVMGKSPILPLEGIPLTQGIIKTLSSTIKTSDSKDGAIARVVDLWRKNLTESFTPFQLVNEERLPDLGIKWRMRKTSVWEETKCLAGAVPELWKKVDLNGKNFFDDPDVECELPTKGKSKVTWKRKSAGTL